MKNKIKNLIIELNSICNNNCIYCYIPKEERRERKCDVQYIIKKMIEYKKKGVECIDFTGGEPTLYKRLKDIIAIAKKIGFKKKVLITNGRRLSNKEYCEKIINAGIDEVVISLDGQNKELAEAATRTPDSFKQLIKAIENIKRKKLPFGSTIVITILNYKSIPLIIEKAIDLGSDFVNIQFLLPFVEDKNVPCRRLPKQIIPSYNEVLPYLKKGLDKYGNKKKIKVHFIPFCYMTGYEKYLDEECNKSDRMIINYKGYKYNMGEHLKKGSEKMSKCKKCEYEDKCNGIYSSYKKEFGINIKKE